MQKINVAGTQIDVMFSVYAMQEIEEVTGDSFEKIMDWMQCEDEKQCLKRICEVVRIFANAAITCKNELKNYGIADGEPLKLFEKGTFEKFLDISNIPEYISACLGVINEGTQIVLPDGVEENQTDEFLEEYEDSKTSRAQAAKTFAHNLKRP